jgi:hypothetical protein
VVVDRVVVILAVTGDLLNQVLLELVEVVEVMETQVVVLLAVLVL